MPPKKRRGKKVDEGPPEKRLEIDEEDRSEASHYTPPRERSQPGQGPKTTSSGNISPARDSEMEEIRTTSARMNITPEGGSRGRMEKQDGSRFVREWLQGTSTPQVTNTYPHANLYMPDPFLRMADVLEKTLNAVRENSVNAGNSRSLNRLAFAKSLPPFSGDPLEWLYFKERFNTIKDRCAYDDRESVMLLADALRGEARETVKSLLAGQDINMIIDTLELQYGNKNVIARKMMQELRDMPALDASSEGLTRFAAKLRNAVVTFKAIKLFNYMDSPDLLGSLGRKLPLTLKYAYEAYLAEGHEEGTELEKLSNFIYKKAQLAAKSLIFSAQYENPVTTSKQENVTSQRRSGRATVAHTFERNADSYRKAIKCVFCDRNNHSIVECFRFPRESIDRRWSVVRKNKLCYGCLKPDHFARDCRSKNNCSNCNKSHHSLLHGKTKAGIEKQGIAQSVDNRENEKNASEIVEVNES